MKDGAPATPILDTQIFHDAFNASPIGVAVENLDGQPLFVNPAFCRFLGFTEEELRRKHCVDFSPREDAEKDWALFQQLKAGSIDHYQLEKRYFRRDGSLVWGRLSLSLLNSHPSPLVVAMVEDITDKKRAEESLREGEERLRLAVQAGRMFAYSWDAASDVIERSGESAEILGVKNDQVATGAAVSAMVHPDDKQRLETALSKLTVANPTLQTTYRIIRPDGVVKWLERSSRAYFDANGKLKRIVGVIADVTERKTVEEALLKSEQKFSKAFRQSPMALTLTSAKDHRYLDVNETFERITGWRHDEVIGRTPLDLSIWVNPTDRIAFVKQVLAQGVVRDLEVHFRCKNRSERVGLGSAELIEIGGETCILSVIADITERKRAEEAVKESETRFRLVADTAPVMIWMSGLDRKPTYFNQLWLDFTGFSETDLQNKLAEIVHPDDYQQCHELYCRGFEQRQPFRKECRLRRHDGQYRWMLDIGVPRFHKDGSFAGYVGSCIDVTEHKVAQEAMSDMTRKLIDAQEQERTRIGRELHDDINQRLAMLAVELEQLQANPSDVQTRLQELRSQTTELSNDVQALSHELHSSKLEYLGVVGGMKSWCKEFGERRGMEIDFKSDVSSVVPLDIGIGLFRILQEALHNALKHSGVKRIEVQLREESGEILFTITDLGKGFDMEAARQGRGLGLTSMEERVRLANGTITIESKPMGGTTILVRVPLDSRQSSQQKAG